MLMKTNEAPQATDNQGSFVVNGASNDGSY